MSSLSTSLKNSYHKWLQPYEDWLKENKPAVMQAQHDRENGTPYTPSPGALPNVTGSRPTPAAVEPAITASQALQAKLNNVDMVPSSQAPSEHATPPSLPSQSHQQPPPPASGFVAVNSGFAAINASTPTPSGFAAINASEAPASMPSPMQVDSEMTTSNDPPSAPSSVTNSAPVNGLKRQISVESDPLLATDDSGRRSKRVKRGDSSAPTVMGSQMMQPRLPAPGSVAPRDRTNDQPGDVSDCMTAREL